MNPSARSNVALLTAALLAAALLLAACASPEQVASTPDVPATQSVEQADSKLAWVERDRAQAEANFSAAEQRCYHRFLVTRCLDQAKEERRGKLAYLSLVENEALYFKRRSALAARDRKVAEAEKQFELEQARRAAEPPRDPMEMKPLPPPRGKAAANQAERAAEHAARSAKLAAKDAAKAAQAPAKVAAFEARQVQSEQRQQKVLKRQAERARRQAAKEAAENEAAAKAAAAKEAARSAAQ